MRAEARISHHGDGAPRLGRGDDDSALDGHGLTRFDQVGACHAVELEVVGRLIDVGDRDAQLRSLATSIEAGSMSNLPQLDLDRLCPGRAARLERTVPAGRWAPATTIATTNTMGAPTAAMVIVQPAPGGASQPAVPLSRVGMSQVETRPTPAVR